MIRDLNDYTRFKSILCLNGDLPSASFFLKVNLPVIAADGAANSLLELGIIPDLIIGDLDSVHPTHLVQHPFLHLPDQNTSDYQKSMDYLRGQGLLPAIVLGLNGGHLDHVLNNMNLFIETDSLLYAPPLKGFVIKEQSVDLNLPPHTKMSLLGMPKAILSSEGLKWDLDKSLLSFPGTTSCFNRSQSPLIRIRVHEGSALVLIYDEEILDAGL